MCPTIQGFGLCPTIQGFGLVVGGYEGLIQKEGSKAENT